MLKKVGAPTHLSIEGEESSGKVKSRRKGLLGFVGKK